jgi:2-amino-4-hydroxy-6-hydroxymethyldihydropteridine diphosphokinase
MDRHAKGNTAMMEIGFSLGTNLGDRLANLREAASRIAAFPGTTILARSRIYETAPVGVKPQYRDMAYLNAVLIIGTGLPVEEVSRRIHAIETDMGRVRTGDRFAPRPIDIDILSAGSDIRDDDDLTLPHPRWAERRFVVQPLADVRPDLTFPGDRLSVARILSSLPGSVDDVAPIADSW